MRNILLGLAALMTATASQAAVQITFTSPAGNVGSNSHTYSNGAYSVTATGYSNYNFGTNTGTANNLYDKNGGGDENGLGLAGDPSGDNEIWYGGGQTIPTILLDVSSLFSVVSSAQFMMGSTTANEQWVLGGFNGTSWSVVLTGTTEGSFINLPGWGTYSQYAFVSGGTVSGERRTEGNVLLTALSLTPSVPEPGTWAMMLLGFGGIGLATRRRRRPALAELHL
jgi:hypothetical protein